MNSENQPSGYNHHLKENICFRPLRDIHQSGYTLIELMIVVTMVGIISSIAYSAFTGYTANADRAAAQADLYELAQVMERAFTEDRTYANINLADSLTNFDNDSLYTFTIPVQNGTQFEIVATATESRDTFDLRINQRGVEGFKTHGTTVWSNTTGWDNIN